MPGTFSLEDLCGCPDDCPDCCGGCCPGITGSSLFATFTDFPGCTPTGSWEFEWDAVNEWWGKTTVTFGTCGFAIIWFECGGTADACDQMLMRFEIYDSGMNLQCSYTDAAEDVFPEACDCDPFELDFHPTLGSCFSDLWDRGHIIVTL